jgi:hypothetical protein
MRLAPEGRVPGDQRHRDVSGNPDKKIQTRNKYRRPTALSFREPIATKREKRLVGVGTNAAEERSVK